MDALPLCACGCGRQVKRSKRRKGQPTRYFSYECVPHATRVANGHKGRRTFAYRARAKRFNEEIAKLSGKRITREELFEVFCRIDRRGYMSGYQAGLHRSRPALGETA